MIGSEKSENVHVIASLLVTFPLMGLCLLFGRFFFFIPNATDGLPTEALLGCVATAIYLVRRLADLEDEC